MSTQHYTGGEPDGPLDADSAVTDNELIDDQAFQRAFNEPLAAALDLDTWPHGGDMVALYHQLEREVFAAARDEQGHLDSIRAHVLPAIARRPGRPEGAGFYPFTLDDLRRAHSTILFNGGVEACRGTVSSHDTLALSVTQLGVSLVDYRGDRGTWGHRLFRRDLRFDAGSVETLALDVIRLRQAGAAEDNVTEGRLSRLARQGILAYAERAALTEQSTAPWRMGSGNPVPFELITGGGSMELARRSVELLGRLIGTHRRFVFVSPTTRERGLLTIGHALRPLEYAVVDSGLSRLRSLTERANYTRAERGDIDHFVSEIGPQLRLGVYRASEIGPPRLFWSHEEHVHEAALIAIADSVLHEHRAFPMLLDLADQVCRGMFPPTELTETTRLAYLNADAPPRYGLD